ncbi:hypothetical protein GTO89_13750 [Heliobacterium gestii]|uniref:Cytosolic protein n=1 Tax=Heliomicrobium gestii TaxID=2699 RepID=A0A845LD29_HELGE|nr:DUF6125 family protein [Heliomicrobium gestii]MBM7867705.1 hypothetical protein [Heliomicrobium gestii]MZP44098.1 hypothetical protein [Heliomicrobium gestii]
MKNLDWDKEQLSKFIEDLAKRWLAHDGLWFQAVEKKYGMEAAMEADAAAWARFSPIEAQRIKAFLGLPEQGGLDALEQALQYRLYAFINEQSIVRESPDKLIFRMIDCRVQSARERKKMDLFPCKEVGIVEYKTFAQAIDPRIETRCLQCPPDPKSDCYCAWEFTLKSF